MQHRIATMSHYLSLEEEKRSEEKKKKKGKGKGYFAVSANHLSNSNSTSLSAQFLHIIHPYIHARYPILILEASIPIK